MHTRDPSSTLADFFYTSAAKQVDNSTIKLSLAGHTFSVRTNAFPWFQTADGGVVFDWCLQTRELMQTLCAPLFGKRFPTQAKALAQWYVGLTTGLFQGQDGGGAVYAFGKWHISPRWLPIPALTVLPVDGALYDDPFSIVGRTLQGSDNIDAENISKTMKIMVDPLYHMFRVAGTTQLTIPVYDFVDAHECFKNWGPQVVHSGGEAMDIVTRAGTYAGDAESGDWTSHAYDESYGYGKVLAALQAPLVFDQRNIHTRLVKEGSQWWFIKSDRDIALTGNIDDTAVSTLPRYKDLKISWLSQRLSVKLTPGSKVTALYASPLYFIKHAATFTKPLRIISGRWTVSDVALAYVRSDPRAPQSLLRLSSCVGKSLSIGWLLDAEEAFLRAKGFL